MKSLSTVAGFLFLINLVYAQVPTISSFSPASGPIGTTVTVTGTNFSTHEVMVGISLGVLGYHDKAAKTF